MADDAEARKRAREEVLRKMALTPQQRVREDWAEVLGRLPRQIVPFVQKHVLVRACTYCGDPVYYGPWLPGSANRRRHDYCVGKRRAKRRENNS